MNSTTKYWLFLAASLGVFVIFQLFNLGCIFKGSISDGYEHAKICARSIFQDQKRAEVFRKEIATTTQIVLGFAAMSLALLLFGVGASESPGNKKQQRAIVISVSSALTLICFSATAKILGEANEFVTYPQLRPLEDSISYMESLVVKANILREVGFRLFFLNLALTVGWFVGPIAMFAATLALVLYNLYYLIKNVVSLSRQPHLPISSQSHDVPAAARYYHLIMRIEAPYLPQRIMA